MLDLLWVIGGGIVSLVLVAAVACWVARERAEPDSEFEPVDSHAGETHDGQGDV